MGPAMMDTIIRKFVKPSLMHFPMELALAPISAEVEMAELLVEVVPSVEKVRMCNSGTEATMSAIRLARGYRKR